MAGRAAGSSAIGTDSQTMTGGTPQFDTANHQYDTSDFDSLVGAIAHGFLSPDHLPAVSFLKAPVIPGRPRRLLGSH
jgi:phospholipase C